MTGLDLESFLLLLRADLTTWMVLGLATLLLAIMVWSSWRSRRALRNCLVLSLAAHLGFVLYGSTIPSIVGTLRPGRGDEANRPHVREIRVSPVAESGTSSKDPRALAGLKGPKTDRWDLESAPVAFTTASNRLAQTPGARPQAPVRAPAFDQTPLQNVASGTPAVATPVTAIAPPEIRPEPASNENDPRPTATPLPTNLAEIGQPESTAAASKPGNLAENSVSSGDPVLTKDRRLRPSLKPTDGKNTARNQLITAGNVTRDTLRGGDVGMRTSPPVGSQEKAAVAPRLSGAGLAIAEPIPIERATPNVSDSTSRGARLEAFSDRPGAGGLIEIPKIYQPRLVPDRSVRAQKQGASAASELAVERALDWLSRHQDDDGGWDGGIARYEDGTPVKGDNDFTAHCPAGQVCTGECAYWEADSALTGLALLTFLGAGYTQREGRYAEVVGKGLDYLIKLQKPDGDLRGQSQVVGMYCHAMATLTLCEAYALSGDERVHAAAERAIAFLVRSRARDGMAWRYAPGAPAGDTSILGWVVMGLKSAKEVGIRIPGEPAVRRGTLLWLEKIATGDANGLARYQPWESVTPTMTAEAWVCRQFLGVGGPGPASSEAADFLLKNVSDRGETNVYYWYYATLALYQHGGPAWTQWNAKMRDKIVGLQSTSGHRTGSWDPDSSLYGAKGGRIYCTTLAALSLEVYYRYLRLYDEPKIPLEAGANAARRPE